MKTLNNRQVAIEIAVFGATTFSCHGVRLISPTRRWNRVEFRLQPNGEVQVASWLESYKTDFPTIMYLSQEGARAHIEYLVLNNWCAQDLPKTKKNLLLS